MLEIVTSNKETSLVFPMDKAEAQRLTSDIRLHLSDCRDKVLRIADTDGWKFMGYASFQEWAKGEFDISWQQVYNIKAAAEFDRELALHSPTGEVYQIPVKHATELRKLKSPEKRVRAYQKAEQMAKAQGKEAPTQKIVEDAVHVVEAEEVVEESPYPVVRQMLAESSLTAPQAKQITLELNELKDEAAQAYIQKLMASYGLSNPDLVYPLGHKFINERQRGKISKVLDEIEKTNGYLAGTPLSRANTEDLRKANAQAQAEHVAESEEQKRLDMIAAGMPIEEQFAITLWKNAPIKSAKELIKRLPPEDLEAVFGLLAKHLGYVEFAGELFDEGNFSEQYNPDTAFGYVETVAIDKSLLGKIRDDRAMQVFARVKPEEEKDNADE